MRKKSKYKLLLIIITITIIITASFIIVNTLRVKYIEKNALNSINSSSKVDKEDEKFLTEYLKKVADIFIETAVSENKKSIITQGEEGIEFAIQYILKNENTFKSRIIKNGIESEVNDGDKKYITNKYVDGLTVTEVLKQFFPDYNYNVKESKFYNKEQKLVALVNKNNNRVDESTARIIRVIGGKESGYIIKVEYTNKLKNTEEKFEIEYVFRKDATIEGNYYISKVIYYNKTI